MIDLFDELTAVVGILDGECIPYALIGGVAYSFYVEARATEDIDFLVRPEDWDRILSTLQPLGYRDVTGPLNLKELRFRRLTKALEDDSLVLDFLLADERALEGISRAIEVPLGSRRVRLAPPEFLIAMKRGRNSPQDRSDIAGLEKYILNQRRSK